MKKYYIYQTTNLVNNKKYIGKHCGELDDEYIGSGKLLQKAIEKYGKENFKKEILFISQNNEENNLKEKEFIKVFNAIEDRDYYNIAAGGDGGDIFHILPLEQQLALKKSYSKRYSGKGNPMYGKHHSEKTKEKLRQVDKSYIQTEKYRKNMSKAVSGEKNGMYGKHHTAESRKKMSDSTKGMYEGSKNPNAKGISAYKDAEMKILVKHFDTIQEALIFVGTKPTDYSGISKRMKENKPYKKYYWKKEV